MRIKEFARRTVARIADPSDAQRAAVEASIEQEVRVDTAVSDMIGELRRLRRIVANVEALTRDTDGNQCGPDEDIPSGEVLRALYEED